MTGMATKLAISAITARIIDAIRVTFVGAFAFIMIPPESIMKINIHKIYNICSNNAIIKVNIHFLYFDIKL